MDLSIVVSRESPLEDLELNDPDNGYAVMSFGPGSRTMRLEHAKSPVSDGSVLIGATADLQIARLIIRVYGTELNTVLAGIQALEQAVNQWSYTVTVTIDNTADVWLCHPANHSRGAQGTYQAEDLIGGWQDITIEIPRQPSLYGY